MSAGKGDTPRPVNKKTYWNNYDAIFRKKTNDPINTNTDDTRARETNEIAASEHRGADRATCRRASDPE